MRKTKLARKSKNLSELLRRKAVTLAKKIIRCQHNFTCEYCHKKEPQVKTHGSHIYEEGTYRSMSADLDNILCFCFTHHLGSWNAKEPSWHSNPLEMTDWFRETYSERYKRLKLRARKSVQADEYYWRKKLEELTKIAEELDKMKI